MPTLNGLYLSHAFISNIHFFLISGVFPQKQREANLIFPTSFPPNEMVTMESPDPVEGSQIKDRGGSSSNKKKKNLTLGSFKSPFKFLGKTYCKGCRKKCSGEVLRVNDVYFHSNCFKCKGCSNSLSQGGFFTRDKVSFE
jgi:hypothetical protein